MRYRLLGESGLRVSEMALGTMTFGDDWGWGADRDNSRKMFERFAEAGGNFIDTACNYTNGTSERLVGEFIADERDRYVVATKYTLRMQNGNPRNANEGGNSRKSMMRAVEASLRRLNTEYIDLLYLHMWDFMTPVAEVLRGMDDLVRSGKVLYVGFSDTPAWVISYAVALAERHGWLRPVAVQFPYNMIDRDPERDILPMARSLNLAVTAWGILDGGALSGKYSQNGSEPRRFEGISPRVRAMADQVAEVARELGRSPSQVAVNWVRQQPGVIPILGARTLAQLEDNLGALSFRLGEEQMARLDQIAGFSPGFPLSFLTDDDVRGLIFGDTFAQIEHEGAVV